MGPRSGARNVTCEGWQTRATNKRSRWETWYTSYKEKTTGTAPLPTHTCPTSQLPLRNNSLLHNETALTMKPGCFIVLHSHFQPAVVKVNLVNLGYSSTQAEVSYVQLGEYIQTLQRISVCGYNEDSFDIPL